MKYLFCKILPKFFFRVAESKSRNVDLIFHQLKRYGHWAGLFSHGETNILEEQQRCRHLPSQTAGKKPVVRGRG